MANYRWHTSIALQLVRENPEEVLASYYEACSGILQDARDPRILDDPVLNGLVVWRIEAMYDSMRMWAQQQTIADTRT